MLTKFRKLFSGSYYSKIEDFRSDSDNGNYTRAVVNFLKHEKSFKKFKQNKFYKEILEHVTKEQGQQYLDILFARNDSFFEKSMYSNILNNDQLGCPTKYKYAECDIDLSPTTLRYIKVASDLNYLFGEKLNNVAEIGCGYGGQLLVADELLQIRNYYTYDLPEVNKLIEKYVNHFLLECNFYTASINSPIDSDIDLLISNYAFSELPRGLQLRYIEKLLKRAKSGYMMMNTGLAGEKDRISVEDLRLLFPDIVLYEEEPKTARNNFILVWGATNNRTDQLSGLRRIS